MPVDKFVVTTSVAASRERPVWICPVVNPAGTIKYIRISQLAESPIVQADWGYNNFGDGRVRSVALRPGFSEKGWSLLADDFHADNLDRVWERFRQWMLDGPMCRPGGAVAEWPTKYLPSSVIERRSGKAPHQAKPEEIVFEDLDRKLEAAAAKAKAKGATA